MCVVLSQVDQVIQLGVITSGLNGFCDLTEVSFIFEDNGCAVRNKIDIHASRPRETVEGLGDGTNTRAMSCP